MATDRAALGGRGEQLAASYLERLGYRILERNYRCRFGELDIIAEDGTDLVFCEVKTRRSTNFGYPSEAVDSRKRAKITKSADCYLQERALGEVSCRFDVAEVYFTTGAVVRVELIKGAFVPGL